MSYGSSPTDVRSPAVMQSGEILIRTESVTRLIWDMLEEWQWNKPDNAMAQVVKYYDFEGDAMQALKRASADQAEVLILHEIGHHDAEQEPRAPTHSPSGPFSFSLCAFLCLFVAIPLFLHAPKLTAHTLKFCFASRRTPWVGASCQPFGRRIS